MTTFWIFVASYALGRLHPRYSHGVITTVINDSEYQKYIDTKVEP